MLFKETTATRKVFSLRSRIRVVAGGTSASKTVSILLWCIRRAQTERYFGELISIASESYPHLQHGAMLDFQTIMKGHGYWREENWHDTKHTYTFPGGTRIEFIAVDSYGKAHGPRRDILFLNEGNNLDYGIADQLITRTRKIVWIDFNPTTEFWFYTEMLGKRDDVEFITLTYRDNEALDETTVKEIESHKNNKNWWTVYGLGQLGEVATRVFTGWNSIDEIPFEARLERYGLDFGYSNDPTALLAIYRYNGGFILDEVIYQKGLSNRQIADVLLSEPEALVKADSAEPKSIDEIKSYGVLILPCTKGRDSVTQGIQLVQDQQISVTARSVNLLKEYRNYTWETDKDGHILNVPIGIYNHAMDALRYGMEGLGVSVIQEPLIIESYEPGLGGIDIPVYDFN